MKVYFVSHDGVETVAEGVAGESLMETAVAAGVPSIDASCGGACSCATCMVYVDEHWSALLPPQSDMEVAMLLMSPHQSDLSRLSCQITLSQAHAGLRVKVPENQI